MEGYLVRRIGQQVFEVTKWGDAQEPLAVYEVKRGTKHWRCNSPGCRRSNKCKHAQLIEKWLLKEYPDHEMPAFMLDVKGQSMGRQV